MRVDELIKFATKIIKIRKLPYVKSREIIQTIGRLKEGNIWGWSKSTQHTLPKILAKSEKTKVMTSAAIKKSKHKAWLKRHKKLSTKLKKHKRLKELGFKKQVK